jgi:hypothetical protein
MSSPVPARPAPPGGPRSLRVGARVIEAVWFVGVPLSLMFVFRLPFAATLAVFVAWLVVLLGIDRFASALGSARAGRSEAPRDAP